MKLTWLTLLQLTWFELLWVSGRSHCNFWMSNMQDSCYHVCYFCFYILVKYQPTTMRGHNTRVSAQQVDLLSLQREASFAYMTENLTIFAYELPKIALVHSTDGMMGMLTIDWQLAQLLRILEALSNKCSEKTDLYRCKHGICPLHLANLSNNSLQYQIRLAI